MIRFLLLLLLLPGAELVANNTDAVESFASTTLGAQLTRAVTPKTMLRNPIPASHGPANKTAVPHPPPPKDGKKHSHVKDIPVRPAKFHPGQVGANSSDTNHLRYQQKSSTPQESHLNSTKMPMTARSQALSDSPQKRPIIRKALPSKAKIVPKFTAKNPSARYQSLPHSYHKNVTSKSVTGQLKDSNFTSGSSGRSVSPIPQRTATTTVRNTFKPAQKSMPFLPDRVKQLPQALKAVTQMGKQLKESSSNTSVVLNTLVNQNSSFLTNSLQHMAQSSNSTLATGKEAVLYELNSLNTQNHPLSSANVTSPSDADQHNDVSRAALLRKVNLPRAHDSKVMQELKSKLNVRMPDRNMFTHTNLTLTELSGLVQEDRVQFRPESTTQTSSVSHTHIDILTTHIARTSDNTSHSSDHSQRLVEGVSTVQSQIMTDEATQSKTEKEQTWLGMTEGHQTITEGHQTMTEGHQTMTEGHQTHHNRTHTHKHKHLVRESLTQDEINTISQHKGTPHDRTASTEPNGHHQKHLHNHTQQHPHSHHKHRADHSPQRNHVSQTLVHQNTQGQSNLTTQMQPSQSQQLHTELVTSTHRRTPIQNYTQFSTRLSNASYKGNMQENEIGSPGLPAIFVTAHPRLTTQTVFETQSEQTTPFLESSTHFSTSLSESESAVHKLSNVEQGRQSETYTSLHTKPFMHRHSELPTRYNLTQTTKYDVITHLQLDLTSPTIVERITQDQPGSHSSQEELTTPTQEQQTIENQPDLTFLGLPELSTSGLGLTTQTLPHIGTQAQPERSTEQVLFTRVVSTQKHPNVTIKSPLMPVTVTMPYLITQSRLEPTKVDLPNASTLVYVNKTQPEAYTDSRSEGKLTAKTRIELSTNTKPITNNTLDSTYQTQSIPNSPIELFNNTEPNTKSPTQTELLPSTVFPTMPELITKLTTEFVTSTEQGETNRERTEQVTKSRSIELTTLNNFTKQNPSTGNTHAITRSKWATDETQTQSTTNVHTESVTHRRASIDQKIESESTTENVTHFTNTEPITRHMVELDTESEPTTTNKIESTETSIPIHKGDKTKPAIQIGTNQTQLIPKTSFLPTAPYPRVPTSRKGLIDTTQSDAGTPTYHESNPWTGPELTINANVESDMQTGDQAVDTYTPTEKIPFTKHDNVTELRREGSASTTNDAFHGHTENGVRHSTTPPTWAVEAYHPTPTHPSERHEIHSTTAKNYRSESSQSTKSVLSPQSTTFTPQTLSEMMSSPSGRDRIFIVDEQPPLFKVPTISVTYKVNVQQSAMCNDLEFCKKHFSKEVTSAYKYIAGFDRADVINVTLAGTALEYKVQFSVQVGSPLSMEQESVLANPSSVFETQASSEYTLQNTSMADTVEPCTEWFSCPRGFHCVPQRKLSAFCLSPCHSSFCQNDGICIHRRGQDPACQCPVGRDFWYMGPACDYRMTHHRLAAIACAVVFCIIICAAAAVFILVRRFQTQILQQKVAQTQSSYRRFSRFDDVPTHFWCPSQTWLTTSASINSLDNPAFSSSEEVFPLQALGSCVCGCQDGARNNAPANPDQQPPRAPPRLETSCSSVNDLMVDSGKASDVSMCSWPMEPIHWTPFPILHQLSLQSPFHARRPHSYFEGMELVNTERSWTA